MLISYVTERDLGRNASQNEAFFFKLMQRLFMKGIMKVICKAERGEKRQQEALGSYFL